MNGTKEEESEAAVPQDPAEESEWAVPKAEALEAEAVDLEALWREALTHVKAASLVAAIAGLAGFGELKGEKGKAPKDAAAALALVMLDEVQAELSALFVTLAEQDPEAAYVALVNVARGHALAI